MIFPAFVLVRLTIARGRRWWGGAHAALPCLAVGNYTEKGFANLVNEGTVRTGWLQMYRLVCYLYDMDLLWGIFRGCSDDVNGICT